MQKLKVISRTTKSEKLQFIQKLFTWCRSKFVNIMVPWGCMGPQWGKCLYWKKSLKILSSISRPISIKLGTNHPCIKKIQICTITGPGPLQRGDNSKNRVRSVKNCYLQNLWTIKTKINRKSSRYSANWNLLNSWSPWIRWGHNWEKYFYISLYWKKSFFSKTSRPIHFLYTRL
jgi:hypothetical protein